MKKVLIVIQLIRRGGVENLAVNYALNLDKSKYDIEFLCVGVDNHQDEQYKNEIISMGYVINEIPSDITGLFKKYLFIRNFLKDNNYDIVHSHTGFFSGLVLLASKINGVSIRVAHSHLVKWNNEENISYKIYKLIMRKILNFSSNKKLACSENAGRFLYGEKAYMKNGIFIPNAINISLFEYNDAYRNKIRSEFSINKNELLVGHVGTIYEIKNQSFLVDVFAEILHSQPEARLIMVGEKVDIEPVVNNAREHNIEDRIFFAGSREDINEFYSAFDIMIFPSLHEGLPLSLIEAQASKLPCLISSSVTEDVKFNDNVVFESLDSSISKWSESALNLIKKNRNDVDISNLVESYDINMVIKQLDNIYSDVI